jgi:transcription initiation factor TFIID subunit 15
MRFTTLLPMLLAAGVAQAQFGQNKGGNNGQNNGQNNGGNNGQNNNGGGGNLALNPANVQKNSNSDGLAQAEAGQAASKT